MKKFNTLYVIGRYVCIAVFILFLFSCSHKVDIAKRLSSTPIIFPDYKNVTIPCDIAPIHFRVEKEIGDVVSAKFSSDVGKNIMVDIVSIIMWTLCGLSYIFLNRIVKN